MAVPTYDQFIGPLLRVLARHPQGVSKRQACQEGADLADLTPEERSEAIPSGRQLLYLNRIGWALDRLKRAGLALSEKPAMWKLTPKGHKMAKDHPTSIPPEEVWRIAHSNTRVRLIDIPMPGPDVGDDVPCQPPAFELSPMEQMDKALAEMRESVSRDLLDAIGQASPRFFEFLVLDLLHAMGYGASRDALVHVGGANDGGIDGTISLDRLGLEKVYVQAKRWQGAVGSPQIQTFMGALQLQGANKGVFLTTGSFTKEARETAGRARGSIVLVDGALLTALMIEGGVGVSHREIKIPKIDSDYFEVD